MAYLSRAVGFLSGFLIAVLVAATTASVVARYVFNTPFQWTEEFSGLLMIWIVFIGAIGCEIRNEHLTIDFLTDLLPASPRRALALVVALVSLVLLVAMVWLGWNLSVSALTKQTRLLGISWFWIDLAVVVGAIGIGGVLFARIVAALRNGTPLDAAQSTDTDPLNDTAKGPNP